ncbi:MAG: hypothetical protein ACK4ND_10990 [Cytophagaceae bacterium]
MKISNLRTENIGSRVRVAATVTWEDCDRPTHDIFFETEEAFADSLSCNPDAFLVGCIIPAMHYGEKRVFISEEICPQLRSGLITAMSWLRHWYYSPDRELVTIEAKVRKGLLNRRRQNRAGFFFSGGIDSFATLRANRLNFPLEHPWSIKDGLLIYGLELDDPEAFRYVKEFLTDVAGKVGITLIPVYTNLYLNYRQEDSLNRFNFWTYKFMGSAFASIAHIFINRVSVFLLASSFDIPNLHPHSLDPRLTMNFDSSDLHIRSDGIALSRFMKTKLIANWKVAMEHLRVCNQYRLYRHDSLNCGKCEKCIRTMLALLSIGALDKTHAFPKQDVTDSMIEKAVLIKNSYAANWYKELLTPLLQRGREDLARAIEYKIVDYYRQKRIANWKSRIKQMDSRYFNGNLVKFKRLIFR